MTENSLPKYVRDKIKLADKGDLFSCYTVGNYYIDEKTLDVDTDKSNQYFSKVADELHDANFKVKKVTVFDFKRFKRASINFPKNGTTVIIGNNGAGKSTILEAIAKNLQFLSDNIRVKSNSNYKFHESEINIDSTNGYSVVECDLEVNNKHLFSCSLAKNFESTPRKTSSELEQFKALGGMLQEADKLRGDDFPYPLFAYYPVERSITIKRDEVAKKQEKKQWKDVLNKIEGHNKPFDGTSNFDSFFGWFKEVDDIVNEYKAKNSLTPAEIADAISKMGPEENLSEVLTALRPKEKPVDEKHKAILTTHLNTVKGAIKTFLSDIENITISRTPHLDMYVEKKGKRLSVFNLSQGEKTLLALVSDIARRLVTLNPNSQDPLHGKGVVIIDELDLHLHPQWQQTVIQNLETTFPKIQFIVSTHSPLILTTVTSKQIKILDSDNSDTDLPMPDINPLGKASSEALAIMNTPEKPKLDYNISDNLNAYEELVKAGKEKAPVTLKLKEKIEQEGYTIDESQMELWRFIASNAGIFKNSSKLTEEDK